MTITRLFVLSILAIASVWVAVVNGQPLFHPDSSTYVRGPDFTAVYFLGNKFATSWTQQRTLNGAQTSMSDVKQKAAIKHIELNSPFDHSVLSGRSVYYGVLLYLGHLTSDLWLPIFLQAAIFVYLSDLFVVSCLRFSFFTFVFIDIAILIFTPLSFDISYLMPDIFASFLVLATIILFAFWDALKPDDRVLVSAILLYSILVHLTHLILFAGLISVSLCISFVIKRQALLHDPIRKQIAVLLLILLCGGLGEFAFKFGTRLIIGTYPVQPPFLMARLIEDGPGYQFLMQNCANRSYMICRYIDRLPMPAATFLWSNDPKAGVFNSADPATRRALASEQTSFVLDVVRFDPIGVAVDATKNTVSEFLNIGIDQFFLNQHQVKGFEKKLPTSYFQTMLRTRLVLNDSTHNFIQVPAHILYFSVYIASILGLVVVWIFWPYVQSRTRLHSLERQQWLFVLTISITAIVFNAVICGTLSAPIPRYQTRISWIPVFILLLLIARLWETLSPKKNEPEQAHL